MIINQFYIFLTLISTYTSNERRLDSPPKKKKNIGEKKKTKINNYSTIFKEFKFLFFSILTKEFQFPNKRKKKKKKKN